MKNAPLKIIAAPNAFKGSLSSRAASAAIKAGVVRAYPQADVIELPLADGGDGMLEAMLSTQNGNEIEITAVDPLGLDIKTKYAVLDDGTAVVEMSLISGINLINPKERNALEASTCGTGQVIAHALARGCRKFIIGIGGSATTDGGAGMAQALGISLQDNRGSEIPYGGKGLALLKTVDVSKVLPGLLESKFQIACDVQNPLLGPKGAARIYAPQKGASPEDVERLESGMSHYAGIIEDFADKKLRDVPGTGAAGGMGFIFLALFNAELLPGAELVLNKMQFDDICRDADLIITGEGCLDMQSAHGKLPAAVARRGQTLGIPVIALAGKLKKGWEVLKNQGLTSARQIAPDSVGRKYSMENAVELLSDAARETVKRLVADRNE